MNIFSIRSSIIFMAFFSVGVSLGSARADSIVRFIYEGNYEGAVNGEYYVQVFSDSTPVTTANFLRYVNNGAYNNTIIDRDDGFIMQGGGFTLGSGTSAEVYPNLAPLYGVQTYEPIVNEPGLSNLSGTIAMAKPDGVPNGATSQWYINLGDNVARDTENGGYTVFGKILDQNGIDFINGIHTNTDIVPADISGPAFYDNPALTLVPLYQTGESPFYLITIKTVEVVAAPWQGGSPAGDWGDKANWGGAYNNVCVPDGAGSKIVLDNQTPSVQTLDMASVGRTVGSITFTAGGTTIASSGAHSLALDNIDKAAEINITGTNTISAPVVLQSDAYLSGLGTLNLSGGISGAHTLTVASGTLNATSIQVDTLTIGAPPIVVTQAEWKGGSAADPADWNQPENWNPAGAVGGAGSKVVFGNELSANNVVDLKTADQTVGSITFTAGTSTTIMSSGAHSLTLNNLDQAAEISVAGNHTISTPVVLGGDVIISGLGTLDLSGGISGAHAMTVTEGTLHATSIQVDSLNIGNVNGPAAVPEPSTAALLSLGFAGLFAYGWRSKK